jgi:cytochrome c-type biogenesis protein
MTGLLRLRFLEREFRPHPERDDRRGRPLGALSLGAAFGFGWSPCVGPVLASILLLASFQGGIAEAAALLAAYTLGLAIPFLAVGLAADHGAGFVKRFAKTAHAVEVAGGVLLILLGVVVFTGSLSRLTSYLPVG